MKFDCYFCLSCPVSRFFASDSTRGAGRCTPALVTFYPPKSPLFLICNLFPPLSSQGAGRKHPLSSNNYSVHFFVAQDRRLKSSPGTRACGFFSALRGAYSCMPPAGAARFRARSSPRVRERSAGAIGGPFAHILQAARALPANPFVIPAQRRGCFLCPCAIFKPAFLCYDRIKFTRGGSGFPSGFSGAPWEREGRMT